MDIYFIGICGTGVGALAGMLKSQGHRVRGSDEHVYPPMSTQLRAWGIDILDGYDAAHLRPPPDLVVVGNVIRRHNPEATWARQHGLRCCSMPQAVAEFGIAQRHSIVIAGTHGKTTTAALTAHLLRHAGKDPSFLVGGVMVNYPASFHGGSGDTFVIEGDEYDTAYFDKEPKFVHYRARTAVLTSLEFDHADIFADIDAVEAAFMKLVRQVPEDGHMVVWHGATRARRLIAEGCRATRQSVYAMTPRADANVCLRRCETTADGLVFEPLLEGRSLGEMRLAQWGAHSAQNALAALCAVRHHDLGAAALRDGFKSFAGVRRRLEVRGEPAGVVVVDDFAHHPTAVQATCAAARARWPSRRLVVAFEPRSATSRRNYFQEAYVEAFAGADAAFIGSHARLGEVPEAQRFDPDKLAAALCRRGVRARAIAAVPALCAALLEEARRGDVVMLLSNGDFGGLQPSLLEGLQRRA